MKTKRLAIVAVETNLIGRIATPPLPPTDASHWPFGGARAEIVAAFVSDLDEAGEIKFLLRELETGKIARVYSHAFCVGEAP